MNWPRPPKKKGTKSADFWVLGRGFLGPQTGRPLPARRNPGGVTGAN